VCSLLVIELTAAASETEIGASPSKVSDGKKIPVHLRNEENIL
jgi:hypothetical protein